MCHSSFPANLLTPRSHITVGCLLHEQFYHKVDCWHFMPPCSANIYYRFQQSCLATNNTTAYTASSPLHCHHPFHCCQGCYVQLPLCLLSSFCLTLASHHLVSATELCWELWCNFVLLASIPILQQLTLLPHIVIFASLWQSTYMVSTLHCLLMVTD